MRTACLLGITLATVASRNAMAYEFRCRFAERIGTSDVAVGPGNFFDGNPGYVRNMRIQIGVFDDLNSSAPLGGFIGWNDGSILVGGDPANSVERRNPGRLSPYNSVVEEGGNHPNGNPPLPDGDPFELLTDIDATIATQTRTWTCDAQGNPLPQPTPVIRARNTYISIYAFSLHTHFGTTSYDITFSGSLYAASGWQTVGTPLAPDCGNPADPFDDVPGSVTYEPDVLPLQTFECVLHVQTIPEPTGTASLASLGLLTHVRRKRHTRKR